MKKILFSIILFLGGATLVNARVVEIQLINNEYDSATIFSFENDTTKEVEYHAIYGSYGEVEVEDEYTYTIRQTEIDKHYSRNTSCSKCTFTSSNICRLAYIMIRKEVNLNIESKYVSVSDPNYSIDISSHYAIYNTLKELLKELEANTTNLLADDYIIEDIEKETTKNIAAYEDNNYVTFEYPIYTSLEVNTEVTSICNDTLCFAFEQVGNIIYFDNYLDPGNYLINDVSISLDGSTGSYKIELPIEEEIIDLSDALEENQVIAIQNDSIIEENEIVIAVPNTGIETNEIIYYVEKKYFN